MEAGAAVTAAGSGFYSSSGLSGVAPSPAPEPSFPLKDLETLSGNICGGGEEGARRWGGGDPADSWIKEEKKERGRKQREERDTSSVESSHPDQELCGCTEPAFVSGFRGDAHFDAASQLLLTMKPSG